MTCKFLLAQGQCTFPGQRLQNLGIFYKFNLNSSNNIISWTPYIHIKLIGPFRQAVYKWEWEWGRREWESGNICLATILGGESKWVLNSWLKSARHIQITQFHGAAFSALTAHHVMTSSIIGRGWCTVYSMYQFPLFHQPDNSFFTKFSWLLPQPFTPAVLYDRHYYYRHGRRRRFTFM